MERCINSSSSKKFINYAEQASFFALLNKAKKSGPSVYLNTVNKLNNCKYARELNDKFTIQDIFQDNWSEFLALQESKGKYIRDAIIKNVDKMIHCRDFDYGFLYYECPNCDNFHVQGLSCHSRFCVSCGKKYRDARALEIANTCINVPHRQITWTIPEELRKYFQTHKELYDSLFAAVNDVLKYIIIGKSKIARKRGDKLGFISSIHTFGRDLKFNPHIHTLVAEVIIDNKGNMKPFTHFNYDLMRHSFMKCLLDRMNDFLKNNATTKLYFDFIKTKNKLYEDKNNGFYVHAPKINIKGYNDIKRLVNYVCRYQGHPAISESRILNYDKNNKLITYYYDPHEDDAITDENDKIGRQFVTESINDFISKLIVHIQNESVHTTRYYGFYANHSITKTSNFIKLYTKHEIDNMKKNLSWRDRLLSSYHYDILLCECGSIMLLNKNLSYFIIGEKRLL